MHQVSLVDVTTKFPDVKDSWQRVHRIKALVLGDKSPALVSLDKWRRSSRDDYKKILAVLQLIGGNSPPFKPTDRVSLYHGSEPIGEMRALRQNARLMFLLSKDPDGGDLDLCVCLNGYWKTSSNREKQDQAFHTAIELMKIYKMANGSLIIPINRRG